MLKKRAFALLLVLTMVLGLSAWASETSAYTDVPADAWYAEAVTTLLDKGIMNGVGNDRFAPEDTFTRASLATVLYRMAGEPAATGEDSFTDTLPGVWYSDAVTWAARQGVIQGYGNGLFGTEDPVTQEQMAIMLWRSAGAYKIETGETYGASNYDDAIYAVRWAVLDELVTDAVPFAPREPATRAQVADMVYRYLALLERFSDVDATSGATQKAEESEQAETSTEAESGKILIAYFSRTGENYSVGVINEGNTAKLAKEIAAQTGGDLFEIVPVTAYPSDYEETKTIATAERNSNARPAIAGTVSNFEDYDTVFIGYPIWWGDLPMILHTFMESYDFTGKTVIPFNTHEGSGQSGTQRTISNKLSGATVLQGLAVRGATAQGWSSYGSNTIVKNWLDGLGYIK